MTNRLGMDLGDVRTILVVLPTWVGDFVMATPILRAVRERFVDAKIIYLSEPNLRDLVRGCPWMDDYVEWPAKNVRSILHPPYRDLVRLLRASAPELAVLLPNSFRAALIARLSGAKRRVGYDRDGRGFLLTDRVPVTNRRRRYDAVAPTPGRSISRAEAPSQSVDIARAQARESGDVVVGDSLPVALGRYIPMRLVDCYADLAEAVGCERSDDRLELFTSTESEQSVENRFDALGIASDRPMVVISPGAKYGAAKCWMPDRFAAVADRLIESHRASVLITCGPGEEHIAAEIAGFMKHKAFVFDRGAGEPGTGTARRAATTDRNIARAEARGSGALVRLSLGELKSLIQRSDLLLCNDAGPRHFAKAFGVPVVTVFGPTHPEWTNTSYDKERIVRINVDCGPCQQRICPLDHLNCMTGVTVEAVYRAAVELLVAESSVDMVGQADG